MDKGLRHDLRDPLAATLMIASTVDEFRGSLDEAIHAEYRAHAREQLARAKALLDGSGVTLEMDRLEVAVERFAVCSGPAETKELKLAAAEAVALLDGLS